MIVDLKVDVAQHLQVAEPLVEVSHLQLGCHVVSSTVTRQAAARVAKL